MWKARYLSVLIAWPFVFGVSFSACGTAGNDLLVIDKGVVRVGIDRAKGGAITWLSAKDSPKNMVNVHDPGD